MKICMKEWMADIIRSNQRIAIPVMTHPGIELTHHTVKEAVTNGAVHYEAVRALAEKYSFSAASVIMDLTVEAEAFGAQIEFPENDIPNVIGRLVSNSEEIDALSVPSLSAGRLPEYIEANRLIAAHVNKPVFAGCIGPYSLAGRLYDMSEIMMAVFINPEEIKHLLEKCTEFIIRYCEALKNAGANAVLIAEPAAGLLSNDVCQEFSSVYIKKIVECVQDDYFSVILHNCGNVGQCTDAMLYTQAAGYHFGNSINMCETLEKCPSEVWVMGNIDPVSVMKMGTPELVYEETLRLLRLTEKYPNFILSTGCDVPVGVPLNNIDMFSKALCDFNNARG